MKEYILSIAVLAIVVTVADILSPTDWKKYIRILLGFLVIFVMLSPLAKLKNIEIPAILASDFGDTEQITPNVLDSFKKNIEADIESRLKSEFGVTVTSKVYISLNSENKIKSVEKIELFGDKISPKIIDRLKEVYGCDEIEYKTK